MLLLLVDWIHMMNVLFTNQHNFIFVLKLPKLVWSVCGTLQDKSALKQNLTCTLPTYTKGGIPFWCLFVHGILL